MTSANLDDSMSGTGPVMLPLSRQNSRSMATTSKISGYRDVFRTLSNIYDKCDNLVSIIQFKKREKHPWRSATFRKVAGFKLQLY